MGTAAHMLAAADRGADAIAMAHVLHYDKLSLTQLRAAAVEHGLPVRADPLVMA